MDVNKEKEKLELKKIVNLSKKISFSVPENAKSTYEYIRKTSPMNSPTGLRFMKRLKELSQPSSSEYPCILCGNVASPPNYCFCSDCLQINSITNEKIKQEDSQKSPDSEISVSPTGQNNTGRALNEKVGGEMAKKSAEEYPLDIENMAALFSSALYSLSADDLCKNEIELT